MRSSLPKPTIRTVIKTKIPETDIETKKFNNGLVKLISIKLLIANTKKATDNIGAIESIKYLLFFISIKFDIK